jgi:hypothetical protein
MAGNSLSETRFSHSPFPFRKTVEGNNMFDDNINIKRWRWMRWVIIRDLTNCRVNLLREGKKATNGGERRRWKSKRPHDDDECVMYYGQFSILSQEFTVQTPLMTLTSWSIFRGIRWRGGRWKMCVYLVQLSALHLFQTQTLLSLSKGTRQMAERKMRGNKATGCCTA